MRIPENINQFEYILLESNWTLWNIDNCFDWIQYEGNSVN